MAKWGVAKREIHAANETRMTIDNTNLAMIAIIDFSRQSRETHGFKSCQLNASSFQLVEKSLGNAPTSNIIIEKSDLYALSRLVRQSICNKLTDCIVLNDVRLYMYVIFCGINGEQ